YASLLVLAFPPDELYPLQSLALGRMPLYDVQCLQYSTFLDHVEMIMKDAAAQNRPMRVLEAERMAWEQIADELLEMPLEAKS
ncbi:MAG: hypothetical protein M3Z24_03320, partial [Chloroflexota bacterium]|nr:hypothetical protein [Chloroflexota bacterium]